jgi:hypothetical protein
VNQAPKPEPRIMRYELTDYEWAAIKPFLPNKPRGVPRVNEVGRLDDLHEDFSTSREVTYSSTAVSCHGSFLRGWGIAGNAHRLASLVGKWKI